jgi:hypothetical protein
MSNSKVFHEQCFYIHLKTKIVIIENDMLKQEGA